VSPCALPGGEAAWAWGAMALNVGLAAFTVGSAARRGLPLRGPLGAVAVVAAHPALWLPAGGPGCGAERARAAALFLLLGLVLALWTRLRPAP
jgi:hypothetical protein